MIPARVVLGAIQQGCRGMVELRALPSRSQIFASIDDTEALTHFVAAHRDSQDLYWAMATRKDATSGRTENCYQLGTLFADLDFGGRSEAHLRGRLAGFPLRPSIVIHSGGGLHPYYLLDAPVDIDGVREAMSAGGPIKPLLRRLARVLDADLKVAEVARVLRVPNTFNRKRDVPMLVRVEVFEPSRRYSLAEFDAALPPEPAVESPRPVAAAIFPNANLTGRMERGRAYLAGMGPAIEGQGGDGHTYRAACWLTIDLMLDDNEAIDLLSEWNATCCPPWAYGELVAKVRHARRYGRHFAGAALTESPRFTTTKVQVR